MAKKFVIGDIHGCLHSLQELMSKLGPTQEDKMYFLGDLVDRGPDSRGVVQFLFDLTRKGYHIQVVKGNHEQMLLDSIGSQKGALFWTRNGGQNTLNSYRCLEADQIDSSHLGYMAKLPHYLKIDSYWLVHAGFDGHLTNPLDDENVMLWTRDFEVNQDWLGSGMIIHGHTPTPLDDIKRAVDLPESRVICLDGGCVFNYLEDMGHLVALELTEWKLYSQFCLDEVEFRA